MPRPDRQFDWPPVADREILPVADFACRANWLLAGLVLVLLGILARAAWLEGTYGQQIRAAAARRIERRGFIVPQRGSIVSRDGQILARIASGAAVQLDYRLLEAPANAAWLRRQALGRLDARSRRVPARVEEQINQVRVEHAALHRRLAELCGVPLAAWRDRCRQVQNRVERIKRSVLRRRSERRSAQQDNPGSTVASLPASLSRLLDLEEAASADGDDHLVLVEELQPHTLASALGSAAVQQIEKEFGQVPGVAIDRQRRREYPQGSLAAHLLGYLGAPAQDRARAVELLPREHVGLAGLELSYQPELRGSPGETLEQLNRRGQVISSTITRKARDGRDLVLTIDARLQQRAETLLDATIRRRAELTGENPGAGAAAILLDCQSGAVLAAAAAPRFDPNIFARGRAAEVAALLADRREPLFDRATRMALPPGSVMKVITAVALLESGVTSAEQRFHCQGYLHSPSAQRCQLFVRHGRGHEDIALAGALARSCNVYFFHHAEALGAAKLLAWSRYFGLGQETGIDLPYEASGHLPSPVADDRPQSGRVDLAGLAIGQGTLTATPLQIARAIAVIANGGRLLQPFLVDCSASRLPPDRAPSIRPPLSELSLETLAEVRRGMVAAVQSPGGTAHRWLFMRELPAAAKTGTAETNGDRGDHAWIAGFAPADAPRIVFVVACEHGGSGAETAGPVARNLLQYAAELGYLRSEN